MISANFSTYMLLIFIIIAHKFLFTQFRNKLPYFLLTLFATSIWGFAYNLDGLMLILITTELTAILLLTMTYTQLLVNLVFIKSDRYTILIWFTIISLFTAVPVFDVYGSISYYGTILEIVATDFFVLYQLLFINFGEITVLLILIITFFSLFFILFYFNLKAKKLEISSKNSQIFCLRKQILQKQTKFNNKLATFQN